MTHLRALACLLPLVTLTSSSQTPQVFGYRDFTQQAKWDASFMAVPDPKLAGEHLKTLTAAPHWASSPEDYTTAVIRSRQIQSRRPRHPDRPLQGPGSTSPAASSSKPSIPPATSSCPAPPPSTSTPKSTAATPSRTIPASSPPSIALPPPATSPPRSSTPTTAN